MKKLVTILLTILACFTIVACSETTPSVIPPLDQEQGAEQGGTENKPENGTDEGTEEGEKEDDRVVTPIQPGGDFNGNGYGK